MRPVFRSRTRSWTAFRGLVFCSNIPRKAYLSIILIHGYHRYLIIRSLFGDFKEVIIIDEIQREKVEQQLDKFIRARSQIERLCVSVKNCGFFRVNLVQAKETLISRCNELIRMVLQKVRLICNTNGRCLRSACKTWRESRTSTKRCT